MKPIYNIKIFRVFAVVFLLLSVLFCYLYFFQHSSHTHIHRKIEKHGRKLKTKLYNPRETTVIIKERIVHLDLKGAPPKISYYSKLFPLLVKMGATGVLIEYEDMFPYNGPLLKNVTAFNSYTLEEIKTINHLAKENNLKVIPLVQTFGHLEFLLKLEEFKDYREVWNYPSAICPSYTNTLEVIKEMLHQVIEAHPESGIIHIGSDEVFHLATCQRCRDKMLTDNLTKNKLYLNHITSVINAIRQKNPNLKILAWDDHFRLLNHTDIQKSRLGVNFEPVVWQYQKDVYDELGPSLWNMYSKAFSSLWAASAFKGAIGSNKYISDVNHYVQNHKSWLAVIKEYGRKIHFEGIILTGWQRYDHFAVLCELLPVGLPALAMSLRLLLGYKDSLIGPPTEVAKLLQCSQPYGLIGSAFGTPKCGDILEYIIHLHQLKQEYEEIIEDSRVKGWLNEYNIKYLFSNPHYVKSVLLPLDKIKDELEYVKDNISRALREVYDKYTVSEWLETFVKPFETEVLKLWRAKHELLKKESWPRRPLDFKHEL
ncbi:hexosaminidase D-like isoform X2 [Sitophilus oryzae]|uniref:beta-N-acetylhexosaminidase n=1 Tax=Sitophilus oryzae TaxID=7048 RepID=A0A6J2XFH5_SITOR|nr:hexosaminidase D-like isoform X2 [Sitophilus oryzae]